MELSLQLDKMTNTEKIVALGNYFLDTLFCLNFHYQNQLKSFLDKGFPIIIPSPPR